MTAIPQRTNSSIVKAICTTGWPYQLRNSSALSWKACLARTELFQYWGKLGFYLFFFFKQCNTLLNAVSSDAATSNVFDSLTITSSEASSHLQGCVSWGYQPFLLLTDRTGLLHLIESCCVTWEKMARVEFYQSVAGWSRCAFTPATVTTSFFPTPLW